MDALAHGSPRVGVLLKSDVTDVGDYLADARALEAAGVDTLWLDDSALVSATTDPPPVTGLQPWPVLAALAVVTHRVRLGAWVSLEADWPPALLAATVTTVDRLSRGRAILGVGFSDRPSPLLVGVLASTAHPGGPPVLVSATTEAGYECAARSGDGYIAPPGAPEQAGTAFARVRALRTQAENRRDLELWATTPASVGKEEWAPTMAAYAEVGATGVIVPFDPRLVDILRHLDEETDRSDLLLAQG